LFEQYIQSDAKAIRKIFDHEILQDLDWSKLEKEPTGIPLSSWVTIDVSPYVHNLLSWLSVVHTKVGTFSSVANMLDTAFTLIVDNIFGELLLAFRQVPSFSSAGSIQAVFDTELLYRILLKYISTKVSDTIRTIYAIIAKDKMERGDPTEVTQLKKVKEILRENRIKVLEEYSFFRGEDGMKDENAGDTASQIGSVEGPELGKLKEVE